MNPPVDNSMDWETAVASDELPYEEALVRLYELRDRYEGESACGIAGSAAARHLALHGHRLAFGCCASEDSVVASLERAGARLLAEAERELYGRGGQSRR